MTVSKNDIAISVRSVSKTYSIAHNDEKHTRLAEKVMARLRYPLRRPQMESFDALKDISFDIKKGEVFGIIGRNGAGKSTLLKILSRITEPTRGEIKLYGRVASLLEVGTGFHPELTGRENIFLNGAILGMTKTEIRKQFDAIVDFSEIERFLDTPVKRYSSGMYVRLAFAVAAHLNPEILILDEVLAVGDMAFQQKCLGKMNEFATSTARTVLFVSHNMAAIRSLCSSTAYLNEGNLVQCGPTDVIVNQYSADSHSKLPNAVTSFDRPRGCTMWIDRISVFCNGETTSEMPMGSSLTLDVSFNSDPPTQSPRLGITVANSDGLCLLNTNNRFQRASNYLMPVYRGVIRCTFGSVPFTAGRYRFSVYLGSPVEDHHIVRDAIEIIVTERDIGGTGMVPPSSISPFWWPTNFALSKPEFDENGNMLDAI